MWMPPRGMLTEVIRKLNGYPDPGLKIGKYKIIVECEKRTLSSCHSMHGYIKNDFYLKCLACFIVAVRLSHRVNFV